MATIETDEMRRIANAVAALTPGAIDQNPSHYIPAMASALILAAGMIDLLVKDVLDLNPGGSVSAKLRRPDAAS